MSRFCWLEPGWLGAGAALAARVRAPRCTSFCSGETRVGQTAEQALPACPSERRGKQRRGDLPWQQQSSAASFRVLEGLPARRRERGGRTGWSRLSHGTHTQQRGSSLSPGQRALQHRRGAERERGLKGERAVWAEKGGVLGLRPSRAEVSGRGGGSKQLWSPGCSLTPLLPPCQGLRLLLRCSQGALARLLAGTELSVPGAAQETSGRTPEASHQ